MQPPDASTAVQAHAPHTLRDALIIALLPTVLIALCWRADFVGYDDPMHVSENTQVEAPLSKLFECDERFPYYPVTLLTYKIDRALFHAWMPAKLGSWAPGVRFMTLVYHSLVALVLWRIFLLLGLTAGQSLFIACVFAVHPLASETVCWISERKNAVAALVGFLSLYGWLRYQGRTWRVPVASALYGIALLAKQSVLGLLPVFVVLELFGGADGLTGKGTTCWRPGKNWYAVLARVAPMVVMSAAMVIFTISLMTHTIVPTPGGSKVMALLTDLEIFRRYIQNLILPTNLSAIYAVDSVRTWNDLRIYENGTFLIGVILLTIALAENRRRAVFGWLWLFGSLGPNFNLVANPHLMQDRYLYLGTPGFFLVVVEVFCGLRARALKRWQSSIPISALASVACVGLFAVLSYARGNVWNSSRSIFEDAVIKEPQAGYARFALGQTYIDIARLVEKDSPELAANYRIHGLYHWQFGVDKCPDLSRFNFYIGMALEIGNEYSRRKNYELAEYYWRIASTRPKETVDNTVSRATAFGSLSELCMDQKRFLDALHFSSEGIKLVNADILRLIHAKAALAVIEERQDLSSDPGSRSLLTDARNDLLAIPENSTFYSQAQAALHHRLLATP